MDVLQWIAYWISAFSWLQICLANLDSVCLQVLWCSALSVQHLVSLRSSRPAELLLSESRLFSVPILLLAIMGHSIWNKLPMASRPRFTLTVKSGLGRERSWVENLYRALYTLLFVDDLYAWPVHVYIHFSGSSLVWWYTPLCNTSELFTGLQLVTLLREYWLLLKHSEFTMHEIPGFLFNIQSKSHLITTMQSFTMQSSTMQ